MHCPEAAGWSLIYCSCIAQKLQDGLSFIPLTHDSEREKSNKRQNKNNYLRSECEFSDSAARFGEIFGRATFKGRKTRFDS
jgi:hypothetical protein